MDTITTSLPMTRERAVHQATLKGFPKLQTEELLDENFRYREEQRRAARVLATVIRQGGSAIVNGSEGNGKTLLACSFGVNWYLRGYHLVRGRVCYYTVGDLLNTVKDWYRLTTGPNPFAEAKEAALLFLDELLTTHTSGHDQNLLRELIDTRYRNKRPTVLLTNLGDDGLVKALDRPTLDRIRDGGAMIEMKGRSMRGVG